MHSGPEQSDPVDFKDELLAANHAFAKDDYERAGIHYARAINEIDRQLKQSTKPLAPRLSTLYCNALIALITCQIATFQAIKALTIIQNYPILQNQNIQAQILILKARALLQIGKREQAIDELKRAAEPNQNGNWEQTSIEATFWLTPLLIEDHEFNSAELLLSSIEKYLSASPIESKATKHFLLTSIECLYHLSSVLRAGGHSQASIDSLERAVALYNQHEQEFNETVDNDVKLSMLSVYADLLLHSNDKSEVDKLLKVCQALTLLMNEILPYASPEARTKAFNAHVVGLKLNYEQKNISAAIELLNGSLTWAQHNIIPKELVCKTCLLAANLYLHPASKKIDLALLFLNIAERDIVHLSIEEQPLARVEALIMRLICEQQSNNEEKSIIIFEKLMASNTTISDLSARYTLIQRLLPLFIESENFIFQNQIKALKIELEKAQLAMQTLDLLESFDTPAAASSTRFESSTLTNSTTTMMDSAYNTEPRSHKAATTLDNSFDATLRKSKTKPSGR